MGRFLVIIGMFIISLQILVVEELLRRVIFLIENSGIFV